MISIPSLCLVSNLLSLVSQVCTLQYFFSVEGPRTNVEGRHTRTHSYAHARTCTYIHPQTYTQHTHAHHTHTCIQRIYTYTTHNIPHAHKHTRIYTVHTHTHTHTHSIHQSNPGSARTNVALQGSVPAGVWPEACLSAEGRKTSPRINRATANKDLCLNCRRAPLSPSIPICYLYMNQGPHPQGVSSHH